MSVNVTHIGSLDGSKVLDEILKKKDKNFKTYAAAVFRDSLREVIGYIIENTPVGDFDPANAGTARGNWRLDKNSPSTDIKPKSPNKNRNSISIPRSFKELFSGRWFFSNPLPYIDVLEFGGYIQNPKRGTYNKTTGRWEIRSVGGFSKQAPKGMYRVGVSMWPRLIKKFANKHKSKVSK